MRLHHALCLLLGVCLGIFQRQLPPYSTLWFVAGISSVIFLTLLLLRRRALAIGRSARLGSQLLAVIVFGYVYASWSAGQVMAHRLHDVPATGAEFDVTASIVDLPKTAQSQTRLALLLEPSPELASVQYVRVGYYGDVELQAGERWQMRLKLRRPHGEVNPAGFDFEKIAAANRIDAVGYIVQLKTREQAASGLLALRARLSAQIGAMVSTPLERALLQALAVGDTRGLSDADWELLRASGITHLIAISGLHVTLLATLGAACSYGFCWLFPRVTRHFARVQLCAAVGLICATGYALLAGFGVPAQRTLLMLAAVLLGIVLKRVQSYWQGFALALGAVLLFDPLVVLNAGAWLSFSAVALLIVVFGQRYPKLSGWRELLSAQALMSIGLLPLSLVFFAQASLLSPLANLVAVPLVSLVIVPLVLAATLLLLCSQTFLAAPLLSLAAALWHLLLQLLLWLGKPSALSFSTATPALWTVALALLGIVLIFAPKRVPMRWSGWLFLVPMLMPKMATPVAAGQFRVHVFDVGQGLSALIQTQAHTLLFDAGPGNPDGANAGESTVVPSLRALGVGQLDVIMISHGDADHAAGLGDVRQAFPAIVRTSAASLISDSVPCIAGQSWRWDGVEFRVLHPNPGLPYLANQSSCVLQVRSLSSAASALFPGDIDAVIEARLLRTQAADLPSTLLISPHHGSAGSSSADFLAAVKPEVVIYPAGFANRFDFPRQATRDRVQAVGAREFVSGDLGALSAEYDANSKQWQIQGARAHDVWWWR
jgi:competence protein ComEC